MTLALAHPGLLGLGAALVSVPILIHLFFRRRHRVVRWAAMDFLLAALRKQRRRVQMENLLLLLLRCAAIFLVGLALARPAVRAEALAPFGGTARSVVLILDTSGSMAARQTALRTMDRARERARKLLQALPASSAVTVLASRDEQMGGEPRAIIENAKPADARSRLSGLQPGQGPNRLGDVFRLAARSLSQMHGKKEVVFLTDLQARDWRGDKSRREDVYRALRGLRVSQDEEPPSITVVDVGGADAANVAIVDFTKEEGREPFAGTLFPLSVRIANYGSHECQGTLSLFFSRDGEGRWEKKTALPITLEPSLGGTTYVVSKEIFLPLAPQVTGPARFKVVFDAAGDGKDRLEADSSRILALDIKPPIRFLPVQTYPHALDLLRDQSQLHIIDFAEPVPPEALSTMDLTKYDVIIWADAEVLGLDEAGVKNVENFVRRGGGLLAYLGDYALPDKVNKFFYRKDGTGLFPMRLAEGPPVKLDSESVTAFDLKKPIEHPLLRGITATEQLRRMFFSPDVILYRSVKDAPVKSVIDRFTTGDPAILEKRYGRGRVLVITTTPDERGFRLNGSLMPTILFFEAGQYLVSQDVRNQNVLVGEPIRIDLPPNARRVLVEPPESAGGKLESGVEDAQKPFVLTDTSHPGFYRVTIKVTPPAGGSIAPDEVHLATVNFDAAEGDLRRIDAGDLERSYQGTELQVVQGGAELSRIQSQGRAQGELSRAVLGGVAVLLLLELLLAWRFGKRRRVSA